MSHAITLSRHVIEEEHRHHATTGTLSRLLLQVGFAAKLLAREIGRAALVGKLGLIGEKNATGDAQKKLDVYANEVVTQAFAETGLVAGVVSEEMERVQEVASSVEAKYILCMDPLDGSSNTDINGPIGTIFGIYLKKEGAGKSLIDQVLRCGSELIAAGYVMYGSSTLLVYSSGHGVHGFTLDRELGEFLLSHPNLRCPEWGHYYAANLGHYNEWEPGIRKYIDYLEDTDAATKRPYSLRYTGALVADLHRSLVDGGIYFYPPDRAHPHGKLRLVYECAPLAFIVEQAGGRASDGKRRIVDLKPDSIHQRSHFVIGSRKDVELYERFLSGAEEEELQHADHRQEGRRR